MSPRGTFINVRVDAANPGQFFGCCGLLELADRLWSGAEGWFDTNTFYLRPMMLHAAEPPQISVLVREIAGATLHPLDPANETSSPILIGEPFNLRLDWWQDQRAGGEQLKVWAGSMRGFRIARAMRMVLGEEAAQTSSLLDYGTVVRDPDQPDNKVEPFYFDGRRGGSALPIDIGFSPDALHMTNIAYPAVEFLCLVGLQRFRPVPTTLRRVFEYHTWSEPLSTVIAPVGVLGLIREGDARSFRFEIAFRTDQRKHKAFNMATLIARHSDE